MLLAKDCILISGRQFNNIRQCLIEQVDKIVDQLMQYIYNYDLTSLRELWGHLDTRMFCRLESHFTPAIRKLENAVLKMYLVNAAVNGKQDRIQEFFNKMAPELQGHSEWKEWFGMCPSFIYEFITVWI